MLTSRTPGSVGRSLKTAFMRATRANTIPAPLPHPMQRDVALDQFQEVLVVFTFEYVFGGVVVEPVR